MRFSAIIGLGLGTFALSACGDGNSQTAKGGACKTDINCAGGQICASGTCVSARGDGDASTPPLGSGGSGSGGDTGGSTGQGGLGLSTGGLSGIGGDIGLGGGGGDGAVGAGGQAQTDGGGSGGASGTGGAPAVGVTCGSATCTAGETCCYTAANPRITGSTASYACTASLSDGGTGCGAGTVRISCASTDECSGAQKCCQVLSRLGVSYSCLDQCAQGSAEIACAATSCGGTQVCCETLGAGGMATGLACADSCAQGEYLLCTADADCPAPAAGGTQTTCLPSRLSPLFKICR